MSHQHAPDQIAFGSGRADALCQKPDLADGPIFHFTLSEFETPTDVARMRPVSRTAILITRPSSALSELDPCSVSTKLIGTG